MSKIAVRCLRILILACRIARYLVSYFWFPFAWEIPVVCVAQTRQLFVFVFDIKDVLGMGGKKERNHFAILSICLSVSAISDNESNSK